MLDDHQQPVEAALIVPVPEVEPLVSPFRLKYDSSAAKGVPAHITINYPFLPGIHPDQGLLRELEELFAKFEPFPFTFNKFARFPDVLYVAPEPDTGFKQLIELVAARFPESPPYEGAFAEIIPHLTVAQSEDEGVLQSVEKELEARAQHFLPITARATDIWLMDNRGGTWQQQASFPLGMKR